MTTKRNIESRLNDLDDGDGAEELSFDKLYLADLSGEPPSGVTMEEVGDELQRRLDEVTNGGHSGGE